MRRWDRKEVGSWNAEGGKKEGAKVGRWDRKEVGSWNAEVGKKEDEKVRRCEGEKLRSCGVQMAEVLEFGNFRLRHRDIVGIK